MQLSPLQSRLAASLMASFLLLVLYLFLFAPQFASAVELTSTPHGHGSDFSNIAWESERMTAEKQSSHGSAELPYEPEFSLLDRSIIGRAPPGVLGLVNNVPQKANVPAGTMQAFVYEVKADGSGTARKPELRRSVNAGSGPSNTIHERSARAEGGPSPPEEELGRRQQTMESTRLWISATTCMQPQRINVSGTAPAAPQLMLYVSTSSENKSPGPRAADTTQVKMAFTEGAVMYNTSLTGDVYFSVVAPNGSLAFTTEPYVVEAAASVDRSYHSYDDVSEPDLIWVDSDANATLLYTNDLTSRPDEVLSQAPYTLFVHNTDESRSIDGLKNSLCGLQEYAQIGGRRSGLPTNMISTGLTNRWSGNRTKQEFYISGLNASTRYMATLVRNTGGGAANSVQKRANVAGGGGFVFQQMEFDTKEINGACQIIVNLTFCTQSAYAVPGNAQKFPNVSALVDFYDDYAKSMYANFDKAMQQIPCEAPNTQKYSLARSCDDCRTAYKNWICSVTIPRCEDFSKDKDNVYLQPRNINALFANGTKVQQSLIDRFGGLRAYNASRSERIDAIVQQIPYKEVLPCEDLCYDIVQSCPASLGFTCPRPGDPRSYVGSYAKRLTGLDSAVTCNYPGSAHYRSLSSSLMLPWAKMTAMVAAWSLLFI